MAQKFTKESILSRVEKIISAQVGDDTALSLETSLQEDLGMDSLELVELAIKLENEFDVTIPDADVRRCATIDDIARLVNYAELEQEAKSA